MAAGARGWLFNHRRSGGSSFANTKSAGQNYFWKIILWQCVGVLSAAAKGPTAGSYPLSFTTRRPHRGFFFGASSSTQYIRAFAPEFWLSFALVAFYRPELPLKNLGGVLQLFRVLHSEFSVRVRTQIATSLASSSERI